MGIVRVSEAKGREGESFVSPGEQRARIRDACERDRMELVAVHDEIDVSGGTPLERRHGLQAAVQAVEGGDADVVMVAYFDRLVRSLRVQDEVVSRVEGAGGRVVALDFGQITGATATQWLSGTLIGAVNEYQRRSAKERAGAAQADAVARGVVPWPNVPAGYQRGASGVLEPSDDAPAVTGAFRLRADGATIRAVREHLRAAGIERSYHGVQAMLCSRVYLGEIHFGALVNTDAHEPLIDVGVWQAVEQARAVRGKRASSDRLLARLGVLRCGTCGARMVVGSSNHNRYPIYRCPPVSDCPRRVAVSAELAEGVVVKAVLREHATDEGRASAEQDARDAAAAVDGAQADLDAAIRAFAGIEGEAAAVERLAELRRVRDKAVERAAHLADLHSAYTLRLGTDWDQLTRAEQRAVIRVTVVRAVVAPGRGADRIRVKLLSQQASGGTVEDAL